MKDINFDTIAFATDPDNILSALRQKSGLYPYQLPGGPKVWLVTRREDVEEVLTTGDIFKVSPATQDQSYRNNPFSEAIPSPSHLLATDGLQHKRLRDPLESFFTTAVLENYRAYINAEVKNIFSGWKKGDVVDLAKDLSYPIPIKVISKILGLEWDDAFPQYAISLQMVKAYPEDHIKHVSTFHQLIKKTIEKKKANAQQEDIISVLLKAGLTDEEVLSVSLLIFIAGSGTTASLIIQGLRQIISTGDAPASTLVDEILFRTSPANSAFPRYVHEEYELSGTHLRRGDLLIVMLASANYDLKDGADPLQNYLSFSKGIHHCIGWYIAKMEAEIVFQQFHNAYPKSKILTEKWFSNIISRDIVSMQVHLG